MTFDVRRRQSLQQFVMLPQNGLGVGQDKVAFAGQHQSAALMVEELLVGQLFKPLQLQRDRRLAAAEQASGSVMLPVLMTETNALNVRISRLINGMVKTRRLPSLSRRCAINASKLLSATSWLQWILSRGMSIEMLGKGLRPPYPYHYTPSRRARGKMKTKGKQIASGAEAFWLKQKRKKCLILLVVDAVLCEPVSAQIA